MDVLAHKAVYLLDHLLHTLYNTVCWLQSSIYSTEYTLTRWQCDSVNSRLFLSRSQSWGLEAHVIAQCTSTLELHYRLHAFKQSIMHFSPEFTNLPFLSKHIYSLLMEIVACWTADAHSLLMRGVLIQHNTTEQTISFIQGGLDLYKTHNNPTAIQSYSHLKHVVWCNTQSWCVKVACVVLYSGHVRCDGSSTDYQCICTPELVMWCTHCYFKVNRYLMHYKTSHITSPLSLRGGILYSAQIAKETVHQRIKGWPSWFDG